MLGEIAIRQCASATLILMLVHCYGDIIITNIDGMWNGNEKVNMDVNKCKWDFHRSSRALPEAGQLTVSTSKSRRAGCGLLALILSARSRLGWLRGHVHVHVMHMLVCVVVAHSTLVVYV